MPDEWHVDIYKCLPENEIVEKSFTCLDGGEYGPIFGKEAHGCDFLIEDGCVNKSGF